MKKTNNVVYAYRISRKFEATIKFIHRKMERMNDNQRMRVMQLVANIDDIDAFNSISRSSFITNIVL